MLATRCRAVRRWCAAFVVAFIFCSPELLARVISLDEVFKHHSCEISRVFSCGKWSAGELSGVYRVVVVDFLYGGTRIWVQWMTERDQDGKARAAHTLSLREINDEHAEYVFDNLHCEERASGITLFFRAENGQSGKTTELELIVGENLGAYSIQGLEE